MLNSSQKKYPAKILLFGEYTVIDGSAAIAIPYDKYEGSWEFGTFTDHKTGLQKLKNHLSQLYYQQKISDVDFDRFERDLTNGLVFSSTVPTGYGLGSSGTLSAAFFDSYIHKPHQYDLKEIKAILGQIEACFHGSSSGLDPLVSYLHMPILVHPDGDIEILDVDRDHLLTDLKLLDTGISRSTAPLVKAYQYTQKASPEFESATQEIADITDSLITAYILDDRGTYLTQLRALSRLQLKVLPMLIPEKFQPLWNRGLEAEAFYMKLCGAGAGGCLLVHVCDPQATAEIMEGLELHEVLR